MKSYLRKHIRYDWLLGLLLFVALGLLNRFSAHYFFRIDLTEDQRYSIHQATKDLLRTLEDVVHINVYLAGELPVGFKQLQRATQELLAEFQVYACGNLSYQFINPAQTAQQQNLFSTLAAKGIQPTNLYLQEKGKRIEKRIFPGALMTYKGQESAVLLLKGNKMMPSAQMLNQSMEGLEYELARVLAKLIGKKRKKVALLRGHGEPAMVQLQGIKSALSAHYALHEVYFSKASTLTPYDAVMLTKPQQPFSEKEKYILDQYIMQGGKVLFFLDRLRIDMRSLHEGVSLALPLELGLDDQLFRYGVRINHDLVQDLCAGCYPVVVGNMGNQPQVKLLPWLFFPILHRFADHLITKNMDLLYTQFISSMDPIKTQGVQKTPLVFTSNYTRKLGASVQIDLEALRQVPQQDLYTHGPIPIAYLLEGNFTSLYKNRPLPEGCEVAHFTPASQPTKLLVVSSGNIVLNHMDPSKKQPLPWGYDPFLNQHFANEDFLLHTLDYMLHEGGLIKAKHKNLTLRLLDKVKIEQKRVTWQLINLLGPILLLLLLGFIWNLSYQSVYTRS